MSRHDGVFVMVAKETLPAKLFKQVSDATDKELSKCTRTFCKANDHGSCKCGGDYCKDRLTD